MIIRLATKKDAIQIARIHREEIRKGFLSQLGVRFLSKFYEAMTTSPQAFIVVAEDNNRVIGFISGCTNIKQFYRHFLKKYAIKVFFILLAKIFKPSVLGNIFETIRYSKQEVGEILPAAELLTIATSKEFHGQGIAQEIFERFVLEMNKRDIKEFKVIVGENLSRAIGFYEKMGFKFHSSISVHKKKPSRVYIYNIE